MLNKIFSFVVGLIVGFVLVVGYQKFFLGEDLSENNIPQFGSGAQINVNGSGSDFSNGRPTGTGNLSGTGTNSGSGNIDRSQISNSGTIVSE